MILKTALKNLAIDGKLGRTSVLSHLFPIGGTSSILRTFLGRTSQMKHPVRYSQMQNDFFSPAMWVLSVIKFSLLVKLMRTKWKWTSGKKGEMENGKRQKYQNAIDNRKVDLGVNDGEVTRAWVGKRWKASLANHLGLFYWEDQKVKRWSQIFLLRRPKNEKEGQ